MPVELKVGSKTLSLVSENVSFSGLFALTNHPPKLRQLIVLKTELPPEQVPFSTHAMCVFVVEPDCPSGRPPGVGVQFYAMEAGEAKKWEHFVDYAKTLSPLPLPQPDIDGELVPPTRRKHERIGAAFEVRPQSFGELITMFSKNLSKGGMFIRTDEAISVGTVIKLNVLHPESDDVFDLACAVRWTRTEGPEQGVGVEFLDIYEESSEDFYKFVYTVLEVDLEGNVAISPGDPELV